MVIPFTTPVAANSRLSLMVPSGTDMAVGSFEKTFVIIMGVTVHTAKLEF